MGVPLLSSLQLHMEPLLLTAVKSGRLRQGPSRVVLRRIDSQDNDDFDRSDKFGIEYRNEKHKILGTFWVCRVVLLPYLETLG